jgi:hypothetical protein
MNMPTPPPVDSANNPYSMPQADLLGGSVPGGVGGVGQGVVLQLQKTKPWVRFLSVMAFIGCAFMVLAGVGMIAFGAFAGSGALNGAKLGLGGAGVSIGMGIFYLLLAGLYVYPALKLWRYADRIGALVDSRQVVDLEQALDQQRAFWKFVGIAVIVMLALYPVVIVGAIVAGASGALK